MPPSACHVVTCTSLLLLKVFVQALEPACEEIKFVVVVRIECRPAHIGPIDDVLNRNRVESLLLDQRQQGGLQKLPGPLHAPIVSTRVSVVSGRTLPEFRFPTRPG